MTLLTAGCVSLPSVEELRHAPAPHLSTAAPVGIADERTRFRGYFCAEVDAAQASSNTPASCESWLHRFADEIETPPPFPGGERMRVQALFVTGAFSECFGDSARPFATAVDALTGTGDEFATIMVGGRSGTEHNARQIAEFIESWPIDPDMPLVLFGYSKGTNDILQFLVDYPELAAGVSAVVSVAGAVGGSPLVDRYGGLYDLLFSRLPSKRCEKGDREVVDSLHPETRSQWLAENALPDHVRYYSLVAFTTRERMARALVPAWKSLLNDNPRNDGQLLATGALLPQSTLLAYVNADHWAVALELEKDHGFLANRRDPTPFPHTPLLSAMLRVVGEDLATAEQAEANISADGRYRQSAPDPLPQ